MWRFLWSHVPRFHSALYQLLARNGHAQGKVVALGGWHLLSYELKSGKLDRLGHDKNRSSPEADFTQTIQPVLISSSLIAYPVAPGGRTKERPRLGMGD